MRFLRLSYIVPRLLLVLLLLAATEYGLGHVVRWAVVVGGQAAVEARVEVGRVNASLLKTRLDIHDLKVANSHSAFKNLVEADTIDIDFDSASLLRKKLIAPYGEITGIRFETDRATSGLLPNSPPPGANSDNSWLTEQATVYARNWLSGVEQRFSQDLRADLRSIKLAEELADRWPNEYDSLRQQAGVLKADAKILAEQAKIATQNPLRNIEFLQNLPTATSNLRRQLSELHTRLAELPHAVASDRQAIAEARAHDERVVREKLTIDAIDSDTLTTYLLGEQLAGPVQEAVGWLRWARTLVPTKQRNLYASHTKPRGTDVLFVGVERGPDLWLKKLRVSGTALAAGQPVQLEGTLCDVTTDPGIVGQPTVLELKSTSGMPLRIVARVDRTGDVPRDEILIDCDSLPLPAVDLGRDGPIGLSVAPSLASINISLRIEGDQITGDVQFVQRNVQLTPYIRNETLRNEIAGSLTESLGRVDQLATRVTLRGTLDQPRVKLWSNIGSTVAESTQRALASAAQRHADAALASARSKVDDQVRRVEGQLATFQSEIVTELNGPGEIVAQLLGQQPGGPLDQLGRLPQGSLFK